MGITKKACNKVIKYLLSNYFFDFLLVKKNKIEEGLQIHVIGDSHASVFSGTDKMQENWPVQSNNLIPLFKCYRIGAITAYNSYKKLPVIEKILKFKSSGVNKKKHFVMLCFGEIDIRVHLLKQKQKQNKTLTEIIEKCIDNYFLTIKRIVDLGYKLLIFGPVASSPIDIIVDNYSSYGTPQERNRLTEQFTNCLEFRCRQQKIPFISLFNNMVDENFITKTELLIDDIHLSSKALDIIVEKLKNHNIIQQYERSS